jgi:hypothetical protein
MQIMSNFAASPSAATRATKDEADRIPSVYPIPRFVDYRRAAAAAAQVKSKRQQIGRSFVDDLKGKIKGH